MVLLVPSSLCIVVHGGEGVQHAPRAASNGSRGAVSPGGRAVGDSLRLVGRSLRSFLAAASHGWVDGRESTRLPRAYLGS
jgi:hypothetical protein